MHARFYAPDANGSDTLVTLPPDEAAHLTRVLRLGVGDAVRVFNGRGSEFDAVVERAARDDVAVRTGAARTAAAEAKLAVTLAQAVLKGEKMDDVIRDAVMIGVTSIQPIVTSRSETSLAALDRGRRVERWRRIAVSSAKQCGRAVVPDVRVPLAFAVVPDAIAGQQLPAPAFLLCEPAAAFESVSIGRLDAARLKEATVIVGPEGGWTAEELQQAAGPCALVTLGQRTLRADAVAIVALAALFAVCGEY